jgi:hypothetical protein
MTPMKPPRWGVCRYRRVLAILSIVTLLLAALITTSRDDYGSTIAALPGASAQPSVPGGGSGGSGGNGGGPPFPLQPPAMPDAPAPYNGGSYPAPYQGNGIDINNPAEQPAQVPQQQPNIQQANPQQLQPANGQQPPDYDAPLQTAQPQPQQQPQQQPTQQQPQQQQEQEQQEEQEQQQEQQQQEQQQDKKNECKPNEFVLPKTPDLVGPESDAYKKFAAKARRGARKLRGAMAGHGVDHIIPLRRLWDLLKKYGITDIDQQVAVANVLDNLDFLNTPWNSSKNNNLASEWTPKPTLDPQPSPEDIAAMCEQEQAATDAVQKAIAEQVAKQPSQIPKQTSIEPAEPQVPARAPQPAQAPQAPQAPGSSAPPAPITAPAQPPAPATVAPSVVPLQPTAPASVPAPTPQPGWWNETPGMSQTCWGGAPR